MQLAKSAPFTQLGHGYGLVNYTKTVYDNVIHVGILRWNI